MTGQENSYKLKHITIGKKFSHIVNPFTTRNLLFIDKVLVAQVIFASKSLFIASQKKSITKDYYVSNKCLICATKSISNDVTKT